MRTHLTALILSTAIASFLSGCLVCVPRRTDEAEVGGRLTLTTATGEHVLISRDDPGPQTDSLVAVCVTPDEFDIERRFAFGSTDVLGNTTRVAVGDPTGELAMGVTRGDVDFAPDQDGECVVSLDEYDECDGEVQLSVSCDMLDSEGAPARIEGDIRFATCLRDEDLDPDLIDAAAGLAFGVGDALLDTSTDRDGVRELLELALIIAWNSR